VFRLLLWDIDGTLLTTGRAGLIAWERAFADVTGAAGFPAVRPDGLTDHQIGAWLLEQAGADAALVDRIVARYEAHLGDALPLRQGRVLDNVEAVLHALKQQHPDTGNWLLTGNTAAGGTAKLRHYRLDGYFSWGAYSERLEPRAGIARRAWEHAVAELPGLAPEQVLVIGDTPHDVECARAIGARSLAVASNVHSRAELAAHDPWMVADRLPPIDEFMARPTPRTSR
jgi:phosphoglycolate phosphatase-like HAD superfamily hydrolase